MVLPKIQKAGSLKGKRVLLRLGLNVPVRNGRVVDDFRIKKIIPTIEYLKKKKAKIVIISHIGRDPKESLLPVVNYLNKKVNITTGYIDDIMAEEVVDMIDNMAEGSVIILGNVRRYEGEVKNKAKYAKYLSSLGDIYVNDAFSVSHRKHASIVGIPKYLPAFAGLLFQDEVKHLEKVLKPKRPFLFVIGGAKIKTKMPLLRMYAEVADTVFVGGALANDIFHAQGIEVGKSLIDMEAKGVKQIAKKDNVITPIDVTVLDGKRGKNVLCTEVGKNDVIADIGNKTMKSFEDLVERHKMIVFNGPLGHYEKGYAKGTKRLLKEIAESETLSIIGGGDTVALVSKMKLENEFTFVSTGGGAMLDFIVDGELPGIKALLK